MTGSGGTTPCGFRLHDLRLFTRTTSKPSHRPRCSYWRKVHFLSDCGDRGPGTQIGNVDLVYEAVGHSHFALEVLKVLGINGIFVLTGIRRG